MPTIEASDQLFWISHSTGLMSITGCAIDGFDGTDSEALHAHLAHRDLMKADRESVPRTLPEAVASDLNGGGPSGHRGALDATKSE